MRSSGNNTGKTNFFTRLIDFFYPLFARIMPLQVYHFLVCGTLNTLNDWVLYYLLYHYAVREQIVDLGIVAFSPHIAALIMVTPVTFTVGFLFSKYITFTGSDLRTARQVFRYGAMLLVNFVLSYLSMKLLCDVLGFWATPSKMITTVITTLTSFFVQKYYSFRKTCNETRD